MLKTNELISLLTEDAPVRMRLGRALKTALVSGVVASALILVFAIGIRHDIGSMMGTTRVLFKVSLMLVLAILSSTIVFRIGRPDVPVSASAWALLAPTGVLAAAVLIELQVLPRELWEPQMMGHNAAYCLALIPLLSIAPLLGFILALRAGAPRRPALAGAAAGLAASAIASALYAWHCVDDSPLFVATWYTIAIALVTAIGAALGRRYLRW
ncbi:MULTISPECIES: NrsF family protein [unclassified Rhizobium]